MVILRYFRLQENAKLYKESVQASVIGCYEKGCAGGNICPVTQHSKNLIG